MNLFVNFVLQLLFVYSHFDVLCLPSEFKSQCRNLPSNDCEEVKIESTQRKSIYIGLMLSFPQDPRRQYSVDNYDDGHDIAPATYLAVEQVNNRTDILKDYEVKLVRFDGGCDVASRTAVGFNELVCSCDPIVAVIGPTCERSSKIVSKLTNHNAFRMVTLNYGGSYESVGQHAYSFGILGLNTMYGEVVDRLLRHNNWTKPALLFTGSIYSVDVDRLMTLSGDAYNFNVSASVSENIIPLQQIRDSYTRIIIIMAPPQTILRVLCMAFHERMMFPSYQWIFTEVSERDLHDISFKYNGVLCSCSYEKIKIMLRGNINILFDPYTINRTSNNIAVGIGEYQDLYQKHTKLYSTEFDVPSNTTQWATYFYDAVWALSLALNNSLVDLSQNLSEYKTGSKVLADTIRRRMLEIDIQGVTGKINFDKFGYNKHGTLSVYQFANHSLPKNEVSKTVIAIFEDDKIMFLTPTFIDGSFVVKYPLIDYGVAVGILAITLLSLLMVALAQFVNVYHRNHKVIKASSPTLNHLIFLGCYMIILGIILQVLDTFTKIDSKLKEWFCNIVPFLLNIGVTLFMGTVCIKTWRLNRLYANSRKLIRGRIKFVNDSFLAGFVSILVILDLFICITWNIIDPLKPKSKKRPEMQGNEIVLLVEDDCHSEYTIYWVVVLLSPKVVLTVASFLLALSTRMNRKEFKTNNVIVLTYLLAIIFGLGIPMYTVFHFTQIALSVRVILLSTCLNISVCICILVLFLPLICEVMRKCINNYV